MGTELATWTARRAALRQVLSAAADLVLPSSCAACSVAAASALCRACAVDVRAASRDVGPAGPRPPPAGMPPCWAGARFEGAVRLAVTAYKDDGRRDLRADLARLLGAALTAAVEEPTVRRKLALGEDVLVVPVPTAGASRRRRGDDPVAALARAATAAVEATPGAASTRPPWRRGPTAVRPGGGLLVVPALVHTRRVADQAHLDRAARARNLAGSMTVAPAWAGVVRGTACVLVDDVVTTGATLLEAARALRDGGAGHVVAATCATTPRRASHPPLWPSGPPTSVST